MASLLISRPRDARLGAVAIARPLADGLELAAPQPGAGARPLPLGLGLALHPDPRRGQPLALRVNSLRYLPDVGDPFEVAAFVKIEIPEGEDAFVLYRQAASQFRPLPFEASDEFFRVMTRVPGAWPDGSPHVRAWCDANRAVLDLWRKATERPRGRAHRLGDGFLTQGENFALFARLALLEAWRQEDHSDLAAAWGWYRAILRSSRHALMHANQLQRAEGHALGDLARTEITRWAADPRVDARPLRVALDDALAIGTMTPPISETLQVEYAEMMKTLEDVPSWLIRSPEAEADPAQWYHHWSIYHDARWFLEA